MKRPEETKVMSSALNMDPVFLIDGGSSGRATVNKSSDASSSSDDSQTGGDAGGQPAGQKHTLQFSHRKKCSKLESIGSVRGGNTEEERRIH